MEEVETSREVAKEVVFKYSSLLTPHSYPAAPCDTMSQKYRRKSVYRTLHARRTGTAESGFDHLIPDPRSFLEHPAGHLPADLAKMLSTSNTFCLTTNYSSLQKRARLTTVTDEQK